MRGFAEREIFFFADFPNAEFFVVGYIDGSYRFAAVAYDVHSFAARNAYEFFALLKREFQGHNAFFGVDNGEIRVGREADFGHFRHFVEMFYALPARFFVAAENKSYFFIRYVTFVFKRFHGVQTNDCGPFIVGRASAVNSAVRFGRRKRGIGPFIQIARRHYVEMAEYAYFVFAVAEIDFADIVVVVDGLKTHFFGGLQKEVQRVENGFPERHVFFGFGLRRGDRNKSF